MRAIQRVEKQFLDAARERRAAILALREAGKTLDEIAARYGISHQRVSVICRRARAENGGTS